MSNDTEDRLSAAMNGIVAGRPYAPDLDQIESRGRKLRQRRLAWRVTGGGTFAVAAVAAVAVATSGTGTQAPAPDLAGPNPASTGTAESAPLVQLVGYLTTAEAPAGDATLVLRDQVGKNGSRIDVWDLHADNGDYYFAKTRSALPAQVRGKHLQQDGEARKKVVAAAEYAAKGDLDKARTQMALAHLAAGATETPALLAPGAKPSTTPGVRKEKDNVNITDNWVWNSAMDALRYRAGSPTVRAGVLRLLGQMPEVTVTKTSLDGKPVLTLAAGALATGARTETLTVNAETGLPLKFVVDGGVRIDYTVTRVSIADVAKGKF